MSAAHAALAIALATAGVVLASALVALVSLRLWYERRTNGLAYYGLPLAARRAFQARCRRISRWAVPPFRVIAALRPGLPTFWYRGVAGPSGNGSRRSFARAAAYAPTAGDVFVATQMKCGTTWMQQLVYEILSRGRGDLGDRGHRHLYAVSPWIESRKSVSMEQAPRIGAQNARLIKTHLPARLCPYGEQAKYIYVAREPVACFASCVDFLRMLGGPLAGSRSALLDWFCSDRMWWSSWPEHVDGWWRWAEERPNVLFVHYEELLEDLGASVDLVAGFLGVELTPAERAAVVEKSGFDFMKAHEHLFEMSPPTFLTESEPRYFVSGRRERSGDVGPAERERILAFCRERLRGARYPAARFYPELAD